MLYFLVRSEGWGAQSLLRNVWTSDELVQLGLRPDLSKLDPSSSTGSTVLTQLVEDSATLLHMPVTHVL